MTTESKTINIHSIDLSPVDENDELNRLDDHKTTGVSFEITRTEYDAIRAVQQKLQEVQEKEGVPLRFLHVCVRWEVEECPNLMMNGYDFIPRDSELDISPYGIMLNMYHYGEQSCQVESDITTYLRDLFPAPKQVSQWDELAGELSGHITKEVSVRITGDFAKQYPMLAHPELDEGMNLKELLRHRYLSFQFAEAPADEEADMYALELIPDYRSAGGELLLRVSEVDEAGNISIGNTIYATERIEVEHLENGNLEIRIATYDSGQKGDNHGLGR